MKFATTLLMSTRPHSHRGSVSLDGLGAGVSLACALHCAAVPLLFGLLPSVQLALRSWGTEWQGLAAWLLWTHDAERIFVTFIVLFAASVLVRGFLLHRHRSPLMMAAVAASAMLAGAFGHWHSDDLFHVVLQVSGGLGIAAAHILNLRSLRRTPGAERHASATGLSVATAQ
jgi:hypothetical protein